MDRRRQEEFRDGFQGLWRLVLRSQFLLLATSPRTAETLNCRNVALDEDGVEDAARGIRDVFIYLTVCGASAAASTLANSSVSSLHVKNNHSIFQKSKTTHPYPPTLGFELVEAAAPAQVNAGRMLFGSTLASFASRKFITFINSSYIRL